LESSLNHSRAIYCNRSKARVCSVELALKGIEHLPMHAAFQNSARVDAYGTLRAARSSLSVFASLRLSGIVPEHWKTATHAEGQ
jgi:hypothetical protein